MRIYRSADLDLEPSPDSVPREERLRELVDMLPGQQRHMVSRVYFGQATLTVAAGELSLSRSSGARMLREGQAQLKDWLADPATQPQLEDAHIVDDVPQVPIEFERCTYVHEDYGRCKRPAVQEGLCASHLFWIRTDITPDEDYHRRVIEGHRAINEYLTETELEALVNGRYRGDGRRLDQFTTHDPIGFMPRPGGER